MSICTENDWTMYLVKYGRLDSERETFHFRDLRIVNEIITGKVYDVNEDFVADLSGTCSPFGSREYLARLTFFFTARGNHGYDVEIFLLGWAVQPSDKSIQPVFRGGFVVLAAASSVNPGVGVNFDQGDTGTGTGMQAQPSNRT